MSIYNFYSFRHRGFSLLAFIIAAVFFITGCSSAKTTAYATTSPTASSSATTNATNATTSQPAYPEPTKKVAFTFDDGPHREYTVGIAQELAKHGFHATFFVVGNRVDGTAYNGGNALKYLLEGGHEIAIHGYTHTKNYKTCSDEDYFNEINETLNAIHLHSPEYDVKLVRPIGGSISQSRIEQSPYSIVLWSVDSEDWKHKYTSGSSAAKKQAQLDIIVENVMSHVEDGSIILMHDIYENTYLAFRIIIEQLHKDGYTFVTVSELLGDSIRSGAKFHSVTLN